MAEAEVGESLALPAFTPGGLDGRYDLPLTSASATALAARRLSQGMVRNIHNLLRKALADACRKGTLQRHVATLADPPKPGRDTAMRVWTPEQLVQFVDEIADHRLATAFVVAHTGMRRGEVLGLAAVTSTSTPTGSPYARP